MQSHLKPRDQFYEGGDDKDLDLSITHSMWWKKNQSSYTYIYIFKASKTQTSCVECFEGYGGRGLE